ncbi:HAD hydrolase, family IIID [Kwoniella dendrophila CBS 6074]|uniref:HAD hydrolase, family IIID n=1 Tax=Kwoniella dendrophila CBS 6074 TaxID=1295534 RepID=A0AAX4JW02_9TREE
MTISDPPSSDSVSEKANEEGPSNEDKQASPTQTIVAKPDIESTPSENKKLKLTHADNENSNENHSENGTTPDGDVEMFSPSISTTKDDCSSPIASSSFPSSSSSSAFVQDTLPPAQRLNDENEEDTSNTVQAVPLSEELEKQEEWWELKMTWSGKVFELKVGGNDMVYDFRHSISTLTGVPPEGQKLINLLPGSKGKLSIEHDAKRFGTLGVKKSAKFIMVGTREEDRFKDKTGVGNQVTDDFDVIYSNNVQGITPAEDPRNKRKIREIVEKIPITVMNEPREGKKLLVLDLDYTIVDTKPLINGALPSSECARPGLHEFLELVYPHYDIVIWSQTHWRWLESKLVELDMIGGSRNYKVSFVSDRTSMFPVWTQRNGKPYKHEVKPLAYFWASFPHWSAKNTIHIDDLSRNFALNPGEGLKIRAFNKAGQPEGQADRELIKLGNYLVTIANGVEDFTTLDHSKWKKKKTT